MFYFTDEYGLPYLKYKINEINIFQNCKCNYKNFVSWLNFLCDYFEEKNKRNKLNEKLNNIIQEQNKGNSQNNPSNNIIKIKTSDFCSSTDNNIINIENNSSNEINDNYDKKLENKINVKRDSNGNIIYPIIINNNLKILNLGEIIYDNKNYHSEKNIFPVGYKSVREHQSMFNLLNRAEYTCEILKGETKPIYKLTSSEDVEHPIIKDSSTACWIVVGNAINELQGNKRKKVTISGTERFGLCDPKVVKLITSLPNADKVIKQMSKYDDTKKKSK